MKSSVKKIWELVNNKAYQNSYVSHKEGILSPMPQQLLVVDKKWKMLLQGTLASTDIIISWNEILYEGPQTGMVPIRVFFTGMIKSKV